MVEQILDQTQAVIGRPGRGFGQMTRAELDSALRAGARCVVYDYCISLLVVSLRGQSAIYFRRPGQGSRWPGLPYTLLSLVFGWWGVPWGFIYTPMALFTNLRGGCDVTAQVAALLVADAEGNGHNGAG